MDRNEEHKDLVELIFKDEVYAIVGCAMEVYNQLGNGFLESVYQEAMEIESRQRNIPFVAQKNIEIQYKGIPLAKQFIADLIFFDSIIVELKAVENLSGKEESQILNYLKATRMKVGILINFGSRGKLEWKRFVY
ncbi:MAG: GxxExxY protein [Bacteroidota bacterium]